MAWLEDAMEKIVERPEESATTVAHASVPTWITQGTAVDAWFYGSWYPAHVQACEF
jgi:hypothetical protein